MQTVRVKVLAAAAIVISLLVRGCGCLGIPVGGHDCDHRGSECVIGAYCSGNVCACRPKLIALFDSTTCVNITSEKQHTQNACQDNNCTHVLGATFCIAKGDRGVCACDQQNRAAPGKLSCLLGCQEDDDCSQSQINSSLTQGSKVSDKSDLQGRNVSDKSDLQACVAGGRDTNFKYCGTDELAEDDGVDSPEDKEKELLLSLWLVVALGVMFGGSLVTAIVVFLFLMGICSGEMGAARGHTRGIPAVRGQLKLAPVPPPRQTYFGRRISRLYAQTLQRPPPEPPSTRTSVVSMVTPQPSASNPKLKQTMEQKQNSQVDDRLKVSMSHSDYSSSVFESISESYASSVASSSVVSSSVVSEAETSFDSSVSQLKK